VEHIRKALAVREKVFGDRHPETLKAISAVGTMCGSTGDYQEVLPASARGRQGALG
jgi:hypothetical protein